MTSAVKLFLLYFPYRYSIDATVKLSWKPQEYQFFFFQGFWEHFAQTAVVTESVFTSSGGLPKLNKMKVQLYAVSSYELRTVMVRILQ
jgi:hypothetical protein